MCKSNRTARLNYSDLVEHVNLGSNPLLNTIHVLVFLKFEFRILAIAIVSVVGNVSLNNEMYSIGTYGTFVNLDIHMFLSTMKCSHG